MSDDGDALPTAAVASPSGSMALPPAVPSVASGSAEPLHHDDKPVKRKRQATLGWHYMQTLVLNLPAFSVM